MNNPSFIDIFIVLNKLCKNSNVEISEFWEDDEPLSEDLYDILRRLEYEIQWRSGLPILLRRIRRVGKNTKFSVRDTKLLRKLINGQKKQGYINFEAVLDDFPGKTISMLQNEYNKKYDYLLNSKKKSKRNTS